MNREWAAVTITTEMKSKQQVRDYEELLHDNYGKYEGQCVDIDDLKVSVEFDAYDYSQDVWLDLEDFADRRDLNKPTCEYWY
jgi:hypothetical protein|tara:strand:- start:678 stop:923 length:246 start_codon:yes stop_codon:yes gene_type:complete